MYLQFNWCIGGVERYLHAARMEDHAHTVKPEDEAQTLEPSELNIAALSMFPEATRLDLGSAEPLNGGRR